MPADRKPERRDDGDGGKRRHAERDLAGQRKDQQHADERTGKNRERPVERPLGYLVAVHVVARPARPVTPEVGAMLPIPARASKPPVWLASGEP